MIGLQVKFYTYVKTDIGALQKKIHTATVMDKLNDDCYLIADELGQPFIIAAYDILTIYK